MYAYVTVQFDWFEFEGYSGGVVGDELGDQIAVIGATPSR